MATVIDALLVTLGLDASSYTANAAKVSKVRKDMTDAETAAAKVSAEVAKKRSEAETRAAKEAEESARKIIGGIQRIRNEVLGLFAVITAGRGLKQLVGDITSGDAALGRMATNLGMATSDLAAWQEVAKRSGGSAEGITGSMQALSTELERFKLTGQGGDMFPWLDNLGVKLTDSRGQMKSLNTIYLELGEALKKQSPQDALYKGGMLGLDAGTVNTLRRGSATLRAELAKAQRLGLPTDADALNSQRLLADLSELQQAFIGFGRTVLREVTPVIHDLMAALTRWIEQNGPRLRAEITEKLQQFVGFMRQVDWAGIGTSIGEIAGAVETVVTALGGWKALTLELFALWAGGRIIGMLATLGMARMAVTGAGGAGATAGVGILGMLGRLLAGNPITAAAGTMLAAGGAAGAMNAPVVDDQGRGTGWTWAGRRVGEETEKTNETLRQILDVLKGGEGMDTTPQGRAAQASFAGVAGAVLPQGKPDVGTAEQQARAKQAMAYFESQGWTHNQAAGLVARMKLESKFNEGAKGDSGLAYGIMQWHPARRAAIQAGSGINVVGASFQDQLRAVDWEAKNTEKAAGDALRRTTSAGDAGEVVSRRLIRPGVNDFMKTLEANRTRALADEYARGRAANDAVPPPVPFSALTPSAGERWGARTNYASADSSSETHINGPITINTQATDARGIAAGLKGALTGPGATAAQMNRGVA